MAESDQAGDEAGDSEATYSFEYYGFQTWVDRLIGNEVTVEMVLRATAWSVAVFTAGLVVALAGGLATEYLEAPSAYLIALGILLTTMGYGWGSRRFLAVWHHSRGAFAIDDEAYDRVVVRGLSRVYDDRAILVEFALAVAAVAFLTRLVPIPAAVQVGPAGATVPYADVLQYLFGLVFLLYVVTGVHMAVATLWLLNTVTHLPLEPPRTAARELGSFADFSAVAATLWFLVVVLVLAVYRPWLDYVFAVGAAAGIGLWVTVTTATLVLVGLAIFLVPQIAIHAALVRRKRERLATLDDELDALLEDLREDERAPSAIAVGLDLYDRRRERVEDARTWIYDGRRVLHLAVSGVAATLSLLSQAAALPWIGG